ncbi:MAG: envelope stress response membrane protein PspB [Sphingomonadales bacterium]
MIEIFGILFLTVVAPLWIVFHYITTWKKQRGLSSEDEKMLDEVYDVMDRMEDRIKTLEKILDAESTDWREKHDEPEETPTYPQSTFPREAS